MGTKVKTKIKNYAGRNFKKEREPDKQTAQSRSSQMSKIHSKNTKFEENFIASLSSQFSNRFVTHVRSIKGNPDIVFEKEKVCIFLDSDFWHGWQYPRWKHLMKNDFWRDKISTNRKRDKKTTFYLKKNGWNVIRIWEHQIKRQPDKALNRIIILINNFS
ncbi:MAG TPA: very short patch repair endonuclease [Patescibacteria group bacterium]|nr:very short patch repair endonuclease [Patescibacteria group bacterium]